MMDREIEHVTVVGVTDSTPMIVGAVGYSAVIVDIQRAPRPETASSYSIGRRRGEHGAPET